MYLKIKKNDILQKRVARAKKSGDKIATGPVNHYLFFNSFFVCQLFNNRNSEFHIFGLVGHKIV